MGEGVKQQTSHICRLCGGTQVVGIRGEWGIQGDLLNKVVRVGHTEKATFEKELKGVWPGLSVDVGERTLHSDYSW